MKVNTLRFERVHGKKPRGFGNWAFFFNDETDIDQAFWHNGSYSEASRWAVKYALAKGYTSVTLGS